jgi:hypothetical protein
MTEERETLKGIVNAVDVKRRSTHTMVYQGDQKIRIEDEFTKAVGSKIARLQWRPYFEKPKNHERYLCMAHVEGSHCYVEHICLYDKERDRWLLNEKEVQVYCWMDIEHLPEIPDFTDQIIKHNQSKFL